MGAIARKPEAEESTDVDAGPARDGRVLYLDASEPYGSGIENVDWGDCREIEPRVPDPSLVQRVWTQSVIPRHYVLVKMTLCGLGKSRQGRRGERQCVKVRADLVEPVPPDRVLGAKVVVNSTDVLVALAFGDGVELIGGP